MAGSAQFFVADTGQLTVHCADTGWNFEDMQSKTLNFSTRISSV